MTRMWMVDPSLLCDDHLRGEYNEILKLVGGVANHPHGVAILRGQQQERNVDLSRASTRFDRVAAEMRRRGFKHDAVLKHVPVVRAGRDTPVSAHRSLEELYRRCSDCRERILENDEVI